MNNCIFKVSRREFLKLGLASGAGLTLGIALPVLSKTFEAGPDKAGGELQAAGNFSPNAFVRIGTDNSVTVIAKHLEMGQGTHTGLATILAEELDADWQQVRVVGAPADASRYNNLFWGKAQGTGGSTAMANSWEQMRKAGAAARAMLVSAAAEIWQVPADSIEVASGEVRHPPTTHKLSFGELAKAASKQPVPEDVFLKEPDEFRLIGKQLPRKDLVPKINGTAMFTQDVQLPGMLTAVVAHPPRFGAKLKSFDASATEKIKGVIKVVEIPNAVAVLAEHFWAAKQGRDALKIEWDESQAFTQSSEDIFKDYASLADTRGAIARDDGDVDTALKNTTDRIQADYRFPFLAHAAMEPLNCVMQLSGDGSCEIWNGAQMQTGDQLAVSKVLGIKPEQVKINMLFAGGSFGRRANPASDYLVETAHIVKASGKKTPIKLVWTREDDTQAGWYRPAYFHRITAALDNDGMLTAWHNHIVGQSIMTGTAFESGLVKDGVDSTSVEGAASLPYTIPNLRVELHTTRLPVPVQWWRSVGSTHTAFATETFIDELAAKAGKDPVVYRRKLLKNHPRHLAVLNLVAEKAGWDKQLSKTKARLRGRGVAVHESFNSFVAQVAEVSVDHEGKFSVDRVVVAVDCGIAVNPDIVKAQMEGGMAFGLSAALTSEITFKDGYVEQSNFNDYTVLRMDQMPEVEVYITSSAEPPTGVGEPATPVIAPAVANALAAATGKRYYRLPIRKA